MSYKEIWDKRYSDGGNSGRGSYGEHFDFKTKIINEIIEKHQIRSVIDFGCGDGNQIKDLKFEKYKGFDISEVSIGVCTGLYENDKSKSFELYDIGKRPSEKADLTMSLDVVYHLIDDAFFKDYMACLKDCTENYILVYSTNFDDTNWTGHVRHREFESHLFDGFVRIDYIKNVLDCPADFYLFKKK